MSLPTVNAQPTILVEGFKVYLSWPASLDGIVIVRNTIMYDTKHFNAGLTYMLTYMYMFCNIYNTI